MKTFSIQAETDKPTPAVLLLLQPKEGLCYFRLKVMEIDKGTTLYFLIVFPYNHPPDYNQLFKEEKYNMPIIKSAIKRAKQTVKRNARNVAIKREIKDATKAFLAKPTAATLSAAHSEIDTAVKKKLLKKNTAARRKANLAKAAKGAGVKLSTGKKATPAKAPAAKPATTKTTPAKTAAKKPVAKTPAAKKPAAKKTTK